MPAYDPSFFANHHAGSITSARVIVPMLRELGSFTSVVVVGCGTGEWLSVFAETGAADYLGIDGPWVDPAALRIPRERFMATDLAAPPPINRRFDLALSVEVAEHLPESSADTFVATLTSLAPVVAFSAAIPGQGGTSHINEQWPEYWAAKFQARGYTCIDCLRARLWNDPRVQWWYAQNIMLYADASALAANPALAAAARSTENPPRRLVHPGCLDAARRAPLEFSRIIKEGPGSLRRAISQQWSGKGQAAP